MLSANFETLGSMLLEPSIHYTLQKTSPLGMVKFTKYQMKLFHII